jgi:hypothetical protein
MLSQTPPAAASGLLQQILGAHRAWTATPNSVRIIGTVTRGATTETLKITATKQEEALVESGSTKRISTLSTGSQNKDGKVTGLPTLDGFAQLDATSVFFLSQLAAKSLTVSAPIPAVMPGGAGQRIHVQGSRSQLHYGRLRVADEMDLYVSAEGLLIGVARAFYPNSPQFQFSQAYAFFDYKQTNGVLLPYRIERYLKGRKVETITVTSYEFDVPVTPTLFIP